MTGRHEPDESRDSRPDLWGAAAEMPPPTRRRGRADQGHSEANPPGEEPGERPEPKVKSFEIDKRLIYGAWEKVRANNGAQAPRGLPGNAAAPPGGHKQGEGGNEQIPGTENKEGTRVNSCSITSTSENYKIILWRASG